MTGGKLRYPCRHRDRPSASGGRAGARCQRMIQISVPMHAHFVVGSIETLNAGGAVEVRRTAGIAFRELESDIWL
jgi:hypothetical protein